MQQVTLHGKPLALVKPLIAKGQKLNFKAVNRNGEEVHSNILKGRYIISTFPDIETRVCDAQTLEIARLAQEYPSTTFLSVTTDSVAKINKWCAAKDIHNIKIWSDRDLDFGHQSGTLIKGKDILARGFMIMENDQIIDLVYHEELAEMPDFEHIKQYLK